MKGGDLLRPAAGAIGLGAEPLGPLGEDGASRAMSRSTAAASSERVSASGDSRARCRISSE
jgi:hypothetical protein